MVTDLEAPFSLADAWNLSEPDLSPPDLDDAASVAPCLMVIATSSPDLALLL